MQSCIETTEHLLDTNLEFPAFINKQKTTKPPGQAFSILQQNSESVMGFPLTGSIPGYTCPIPDSNPIDPVQSVDHRVVIGVKMMGTLRDSESANCRQ